MIDATLKPSSTTTIPFPPPYFAPITTTTTTTTIPSRIKADAVLVHWACHYLSSTKAATRTDEEACGDINSKLQLANPNSNWDSKLQTAISYAPIARAAHK